MKKTWKAIVSMLMIITLLLSVGVVASAESTVTSFSDVPATHWSHETVMNMTKMGLFKGMTEPVNGVSEFWPDRTMSRAEFITVSVRAMYPEEAKSIKNQAGDWWRGYYELALEKRILFANELDNGALNTSMTRQEMAMVMVRCVENNGEVVTDPISTDRIADYATISSFYKNYVQKCFSLGLICGIDDIGTFAPSMSLTRAQAATVLCRLVDKSARVSVDNIVGVVLPWENGGKQPKDYTWEEYLSLDPEIQALFPDGFENLDAYIAWYEKNCPDYNVGSTADPSKKAPEDYTWEEYQAMSPEEQALFPDAFESMDAYLDWYERVNPDNNPKPSLDLGGRRPEDYTWEEYQALSMEEQMQFVDAFDTYEDFLKWFDRVSP